MITRYHDVTGMPFHPSVNSWNEDMTDYHAFREIAPRHTGIILEVGFMYLDHDVLTKQRR